MNVLVVPFVRNRLGLYCYYIIVENAGKVFVMDVLMQGNLYQPEDGRIQSGYAMLVVDYDPKRFQLMFKRFMFFIYYSFSNYEIKI